MKSNLQLGRREPLAYSSERVSDEIHHRRITVGGQCEFLVCACHSYVEETYFLFKRRALVRHRLQAGNKDDREFEAL